MRKKIIKGMLALVVLAPSMSFAFFDSINDSLNKVSDSAKKTADMSNQAQANIDKVKNLPDNYTADTDVDFDASAKAKEYATQKLDENTGGAVSKTRETADNVNQTKDAISKTGKSLSSLFS
ncbi:hypothetical protein LO80_01485 [Candidatus Francisella endociliophora]|uniref:Uncharacterized protein n=1 Tax=Candidatus Francisella endociliophora TaxID=653937 RepID=A0A097EMI0_9GAMM|nr:hypothetical protein [Francisella sp. FSC1006]AIT08777.1 hypothetical protein LO80_01485 [Francisella sp. FSC1006]